MAFMFSDAGLDFLLGQYPKGATQVTTTYLELFTSQTASTVIAHDANTNTITETSYTSYARQAMAAATWGAASEYSTTLGRQTIYPQITFPTVGASGATINGFMIASTNAAPTSSNIVCQANFDDMTAVVLATNDVIKVTPTLVLLH